MGFSSRTLVKAGRKEHRCDNCGQPIEIGQPSVLGAGVHEGDFGSWRSHPECDELWNQVFRDMDSWDYGMDIDTLEALGLGRDELIPTLEEYAKAHPVAVARLMVTVDKWREDS